MTKTISSIPEGTWRRFERDQVRRERLRLLRHRVIRPAHLMQPQMMVKNDDAPNNPNRPWSDSSWTPGLKGVNY